MDNPEWVYLRYSSELLAFIQHRAGSRELAQDILHDVFVKILGRNDCLREPAKITPWLYQVTRNAIIDRFRSNRRHEELPAGISDNNEDATAEAKLASVLRPMIETLPKIYRDAVIHSDLDGIPLKQIAEREGITLSAVKSRVQRGRRLLEAALRDCCAFEFSSRGEIMDFWPKSAGTCRCLNSPDHVRFLSGTPTKEEGQRSGFAAH